MDKLAEHVEQQTAASASEWYGTGAAAKELGVHPSTVLDMMIRQGKLRGRKINGRWQVSCADVLALIANARTAGPPEAQPTPAA